MTRALGCSRKRKAQFREVRDGIEGNHVARMVVGVHQCYAKEEIRERNEGYRRNGKIEEMMREGSHDIAKGNNEALGLHFQMALFGA